MTQTGTISRSWFKEWLTPDESRSHRVRRIVARKRTRFQRAVVADTPSFGRCLVLDGEMQSSQLDEFIYHEALVHPALMAHPGPKTVLVLGGGEGATVRELLKHKSVEKIVMVDIDGEVVDLCKRYLASWHRGSFSSRKLELVIDDARAYVENTHRRFDVIISDLPTPLAGGPVARLYALEFYRLLRRRLNKGGVFVTQAGSGNFLEIEVHCVIHSTVRRGFKSASAYYAHVPSFDGPWGFVIGTGGADPKKLSSARVDAQIHRRVKGSLSFYDGGCHAGLFHFSKHIRTLLGKERRVIAKTKPVHFHK